VHGIAWLSARRGAHMIMLQVFWCACQEDERICLLDSCAR